MESAAQPALPADRFARCARFAAAEARAVGRLTQTFSYKVFHRFTQAHKKSSLEG